MDDVREPPKAWGTVRAGEQSRPALRAFEAAFEAAFESARTGRVVRLTGSAG